MNQYLEVFIISLACASIYAQETSVTITLFATDLNGCDPLSSCDPFVKILCSSVSSDWKECERTQVIQNDNYPVWPERFNIQYIPSENQRWRFDIIDQDLGIDDPIGSVSTTVKDFLNATDSQPIQSFNLNGRGYFYVQRRL